MFVKALTGFSKGVIRGRHEKILAARGAGGADSVQPSAPIAIPGFSTPIPQATETSIPPPQLPQSHATPHSHPDPCSPHSTVKRIILNGDYDHAREEFRIALKERQTTKLAPHRYGVLHVLNTRTKITPVLGYPFALLVSLYPNSSQTPGLTFFSVRLMTLWTGIRRGG